MQNIVKDHTSSRRAFMKAVAGAAVVALDPVSRTWLGTAQAIEYPLSVPSLDGELKFDAATRRAHAEDFGHIVSEAPSAVLLPGSVRDVSTMVDFCRSYGIRIATRGTGHTTMGQSQVEGGLVVDMTSLNQVVAVKPGHVVVQTGTLWSDLLDKVIASGQTTPVFPDFLGLSLGGTLSVGGVGVTSWLHGALVDHVLELEVVTGMGEVLTCSASQNRELFDAVRAGQGQVGILTQASLRLVPAPLQVRSYTLAHANLETLIDDSKLCRDQGRFDAVLAQNLPPPQDGAPRANVLFAHKFYDNVPPDDNAALAGLHHVAVLAAASTSFLEFVHHLPPLNFSNPHPVLDVMLPDSEALPFVTEALSLMAADPAVIVQLFAWNTSRFHAPLMSVCAAPRGVGIDFLRFGPPIASVVEGMLAINRHLFETCRGAGGALYPFSAVRMDGTDWKRHYGENFETLRKAKKTYDPQCVFASGPDIFAPGSL
jgi:cytokinin dehydrogenase